MAPSLPTVAGNRPSGSPAGVRNYQAICLAALLVLTLSLLQRGYGLWCLLPLGVGLLGTAFRMGLAPLMLLTTLLMQMIYQFLDGWSPYQPFHIADLIQCAAVLAYVSSQYRLYSLTHSPLPSDPRERQLAGAVAVPKEPSRRTVSQRELAALLVGVVVWSVLAQVVWACLPEDWHYLRIAPHGWRLIVLTWAAGVGVVIGVGFLGYLARENMTHAEATLFLQDVLWKESRTEQRRANRWIAWSRLRRARPASSHLRSKELP